MATLMRSNMTVPLHRCADEQLLRARSGGPRLLPKTMARLHRTTKTAWPRTTLKRRVLCRLHRFVAERSGKTGATFPA